MNLILIGAGHSHLFIAKNCRNFIKKGIYVTMVSPENFWYSGLATGVLGGQYDPAEDQIDPKRLIEYCGGTFIRDSMIDLDPINQFVVLESGKRLAYNALSLNIGSEVAADAIPGALEHAWAVKPISNLWRLRMALEEKFKNGESPTLRIVVVGGGSTGCEIAANLNALARRHRKNCLLTLITKSDRLTSEYSPNISLLLERLLLDRGISVLKSASVTQIKKRSVLTPEEEYPADFVILATGLQAPRLLRKIEFAGVKKQGLEVNRFLQSGKYPSLFGAGDCISLEGYDLPKLGVFGVREAPVLSHNLLSFLQEEPLSPYVPQRKCLSILNLGDGTGLAIREPLYWHGRISYWLKDAIDRIFLNSYRGYFGIQQFP